MHPLPSQGLSRLDHRAFQDQHSTAYLRAKQFRFLICSRARLHQQIVRDPYSHHLNEIVRFEVACQGNYPLTFASHFDFVQSRFHFAASRPRSRAQYSSRTHRTFQRHSFF